MRNKKGFTLIELIGVIVIIGIILLITVPGVSRYILNSRKSSYISTVSSYLETVRGEYEMKSFGSYLEDDELMIVPTKLISLDQGNMEESPFGAYLPDQSYVVIVPSKNSAQFYANFLDESLYGVSMLPSNNLTSDQIEQIDSNEIIPLSSFASCSLSTKKYQLSEVVFAWGGKEYIPCEYRFYQQEHSEEQECSSVNDIPVIVMCEA